MDAPFMDLQEHAKEQIAMTDAADKLSLREFEFVSEWAADKIDNYYDCDCDEDGFFECTNYEAMVEDALAELRKKDEEDG